MELTKIKPHRFKGDMIGQVIIRERYGWTSAMMKQLLPEAQILQSSKYVSPTKVWHTHCVERIMETPEYKMALAEAAPRKRRAKMATETKISKIVAEMKDELDKIRVDSSYTEVQLRIAAIRAQRRWYKNIPDWKRSSVPADFDIDEACKDEKIVQIWVLHYIEDNLVNRHEIDCEVTRRVGGVDAWLVYRNAVLDKIAEAYPQYREACMRKKHTY